MMGSTYANRIQTFIGLALLLITVLGFVLSLVLQLPKQNVVAERAQTLDIIPRDFFSTNATTEEIRKLSIPNGVPVNLDSNNLGRSNVFESY